jgi:hypothetical protein
MVIISEEFVFEWLSSIHKDHVGHKFKDDGSVKAVETPRLTTHNTGIFINREQKRSPLGRTDASVLVGYMWKMSEIAVYLSLIRGENK